MPSAIYETREEISLGYDFGNKETRLQLELLDDLQKLGVSKYIDLPQLVVVGDQSTGKSSVLQAVTEMPFPIDDKMCTRFATEIVLQKTSDEETSIIISIVPAVDETSDRKRELEAWQPIGIDQESALTKSTMQSVLSQAEEVIFGDSGISGKYTTSKVRRRQNRLSGSTLRITRKGPHENNLKIIDVPGLVRGNDMNDEHRTAKALVEKYLANSRSIIVVVIDVVDLERQEIFQMLDDLPDQESRVIGVVNKCDTKQKKSHDWVFDLIRNVDSTKSQKYLKEGWYGLRNRQAYETGISDHERDKLEAAFFKGDEWNSLDQSKLGRHKLKDALVKMLNRHIKKSIPGLLTDIQKKVDVCNNRIHSLGEPRTTNPAQFMLVNRIAMQYSQKVRSGLRGHYNDLSNSQTFIRGRVLNDLDAFQQEMAINGLCHRFRTSEEDGDILAVVLKESNPAANLLKTSTYQWIHTAIQNYRANSDRRRANPEVEIKLWQEQTVSWKEIAAEALRKVEETVNTINDSLFQEVCPEQNLRLKLTNWLNEDFTRASHEAREELQRLLSDEREAQLFSLQPMKSSKEQEYRDKRIQAVAEKLAKLDPTTAKPFMAQPSLDVRMIDSRQVIASLIHGESDVVGVLETHDSLAAHYDIALYRFIDNFALQVIERHLLGPNGPLRLFNSEYVSQKLYGPGNAVVLNSLAGEDPVVAQEREDLLAEKASLEESRRKVQGFRNSSA